MKDLEDLYRNYKDEGLGVLGFPCNQFKNQEPGTDEEIKNYYRNEQNITFPLFSKIDVNGENESPIYKFLKSEQGGIFSEDIKWNFTKFIVDRKGNAVDRFAPSTGVGKIEKKIQKYL